MLCKHESCWYIFTVETVVFSLRFLFILHLKKNICYCLMCAWSGSMGFSLNSEYFFFFGRALCFFFCLCEKTLNICFPTHAPTRCLLSHVKEKKSMRLSTNVTKHYHVPMLATIWHCSAGVSMCLWIQIFCYKKYHLQNSRLPNRCTQNILSEKRNVT